MSDLLSLDLAAARDALANKEVSSTELTDAYLQAMEASANLNCYVTTTADKARAMAGEADARLASGNALPLDGIPLGIKDLFCTQGVLTTAGSHILDGFKPEYESTVTGNLWRDGAVMLGKLNMDEFAMGSANVTSYTARSKAPGNARTAAMPVWCRAAPPVVRHRRWRHAWRWRRRAPIPAARSASPEAFAASSA